MQFQIPSQFAEAALSRVMSLSLDFLIIAGILSLVFLYSFLRGKRNAIALLFALYVSGILLTFFPFWGSIINASFEKHTILIKWGVFAVMLIFLKTLFRKMLRAGYSEKKVYKFLDASILSIIISGIIFSYAFMFLDVGAVYAPVLSPESPIASFFSGAYALSAWFFASFLYLYASTREE